MENKTGAHPSPLSCFALQYSPVFCTGQVSEVVLSVLKCFLVVLRS